MHTSPKLPCIVQAPLPAWSFTGHLIYWAEERMDSYVCGAQRSGSVWNPSKRISKHAQRELMQSHWGDCVCVIAVLLDEVRVSLVFLRGPVTSLSVHPSGKLALTVGTDKTLRWNLQLYWEVEWFNTESKLTVASVSLFRTWNLINGRSAFIKNIKQSEPPLGLWAFRFLWTVSSCMK